MQAPTWAGDASPVGKAGSGRENPAARLHQSNVFPGDADRCGPKPAHQDDRGEVQVLIVNSHMNGHRHVDVVHVKRLMPSVHRIGSGLLPGVCRHCRIPEPFDQIANSEHRKKRGADNDDERDHGRV
ncbi:MAG: hypothetical protein D8M59_13315 [Planctomycetes bacterium]|nr:hypothetical protein [Planctomycetota bacterium]